MIAFFFGLFWGSFLNNIALRLEKGESFIFSRSKCPFCKKILTWKELIPILSFVLQKGRCTNCGSKISIRYPLIEIVTAIWTYLLFLSLKTNLTFFSLLEFTFYFLFLSILFVLALYDFKTFLVDDRFILGGVIIGITFLFFKIGFHLPSRDFSFLLNSFFYSLVDFNYPIVSPEKKIISDFLISALLSSFLFLFIFLITAGKGMGFGDVKVAFLMGLFLKLGDAILAIMLASLLGSFWGIVLFIKNKIKSSDSSFSQPIPFIPFLFLGTLFSILAGEKIATFYFSFFKF